jgi:hypothetical protein
MKINIQAIYSHLPLLVIPEQTPFLTFYPPRIFLHYLALHCQYFPTYFIVDSFIDSSISFLRSSVSFNNIECRGHAVS